VNLFKKLHAGSKSSDREINKRKTRWPTDDDALYGEANTDG